jgi:hypothetical protein
MNTGTTQKPHLGRFGFSVPPQEREDHIRQLEARGTQLDAVAALPAMPPEWFIHGPGIHPSCLALASEEVRGAMGVSLEEVPHLAYFAEVMDEDIGVEVDPSVDPDYLIGESVFKRLEAAFGEDVNPTRAPDERKGVTRRIAYERGKL